MKTKRILAALLTAAALTVPCALGVGAEKAKTPTTINWENTGSITIHEYVAKDSTDFENGPRDNGENGVEGDYTPLNGITFTVYQVESKEWVEAYYQSGSEESVPTVSDFIDENDQIKTDINAENVATITTGDPEHADWAAGVAKAEELELGLYLVMETDKPEYVNSVVEPFLVSIPMTDALGENWLYDVTVNPKSVIKYGTAVLQVTGKTGQSLDSTLMEGYKFWLYKWNTEDSAWTRITRKSLNGKDNAGDIIGADGELETGENGQVEVTGLAQGVYAFAETDTNESHGYILDDGVAYVFKLDNAGNIEQASENDVTENNFGDASKELVYAKLQDNVVTIVNNRPDFELKVKNRAGGYNSGAGKNTNDADYGIGDTVLFELTVTVPENVEKLSRFEVTSTVNTKQLGFLADIDNVNDSALYTAAVTGEDDIEFTYVEDYVLLLDEKLSQGTSTMTIDFKSADNTEKLASYAGKNIIITYKVKVLDGATIAGNGNAIVTNLIYSQSAGSDYDDNVYYIEDRGTIYTFGTGILKKGEGGNSDNDMSGVTFDLYKKAEDYEQVEGNLSTAIKGQTYTETDVIKNAQELGLTDNGAEKWFKIKGESIVIGDGNTVDVVGLPQGTYRFVETKTKEGYNLLSKPVDARLQIDYVTNRTTSDTYKDRVLEKNGNPISSVRYAGTQTEVQAEDRITIINRAGFTLPATGGRSAAVLGGVGGVLVLAGAGLLLGVKKKKDE